MPARTPLPAKPVMALVRASRAGGERSAPAPEPLPSAELVEIRQLRADLTSQIPAQQQPPGSTPVTVTVVDEDRLRPWLWRYRHVLRVFYVALTLAASKALILAPSFLPLIGLGVAVGLGIAAAAWLRKTSTATVLTTGQREKFTDVGDDVLRWVERLTSPRAGAVATVVCAAGWWLRPDDLLTAGIALAASTGVVAGARAWRFRIRPQPVEAVTELPFGPREAWIAHVALGDKHLERAIVTGPSDVINPKGDRIGFCLTVELPEGSPAAAKFSSAVKDSTATTFKVGADMDVIIGLDARNAAWFTVTVLDTPGSSALDHVHRYERSTFDVETGTFRLGYRADWAPALVQLYNPDHGARHGHLSGETGGGKSATLELILQNAASSGLIIPIIIDIAQTLTDWSDRTPVYVTTREDALLLLKNMEALHDHRMTKMREMRRIIDGQDAGVRKVYPIDAAHPMYLAVFDEWAHHVSDHKVDKVSKALLDATEDVITQTRKTMQGLLLVGQATGLVPGFGNNQNIRTQCQAGYMIAHRNNNESGRQVFGNGLRVDPSTIPMGLYGAGFAASVVDQRDAMTRTEWVEHPGLHRDEIAIPPVPADELAILMRGLSIPGGLPLDTPAPARTATADVPAVVVERPSLTVINTSASDQLKEAMKAWARTLERPVQRQEFLTEFRDVRGVASRYKVDKALADMRESDEMDSDPEGFYTIKEAA
jgi:hypothetical protein